MDGTYDWSNYDTGPFCRHWSDPSDCDRLCANCGHRCTMHAFEDGERMCYEPDCRCATWKETE